MNQPMNNGKASSGGSSVGKIVLIIVGVVGVICLICVAAGGVLGYLGFSKMTEVFQQIESEAGKHQVVMEKLGGIEPGSLKMDIQEMQRRQKENPGASRGKVFLRVQGKNGKSGFILMDSKKETLSLEVDGETTEIGSLQSLKIENANIESAK